MADDLTLPATGAVVATDEVPGSPPRHFQLVKIDLGGNGLTVPLVSTDGIVPVKGTVDLGATSLAALESITVGGSVELGATSLAALENISVGGTVELGATSLAALETISIGGAIELGATSLAALENITVGGTVDLSPASLAALENITVGGTVELGASSLAALEDITVSGTVDLGATSLAALESITAAGPLTDAQLRASAVPSRIASFAYPISTANSSTAQLAAGATFTGTWETPQDQPSMSILLTSDQDTTITVQQAIDAAGTFLAPNIVFYVRAGEGFARSITINGNYVRVTAQNTGASTTTTFNLNVAFGNLGDADSTGTQPVTELPLVLTGQAAQTAVVNNILTPTAGAAGLPVSGFRSASVQVVSTGTGGTFIFEQSNDGTNWVALPVFNAALVTGVPITAAITASASQIIYTFPVRANFLRLRIATTITGGSIRAFTRLSTESWTAAAQLVASNTATNLLAQVSGTVTANIGTGSLAAGSNAIGDFGIQYRGNNTGAASLFNYVSPATPAGGSIKGSSGRVIAISLVNTSAGVRWVKLFNATSVTMGATSAVVDRPIPAGGTFEIGAEGGFGFATGIQIAVTAARGQTDNTATGLALGDVAGFIAFQ